MSTMIHVVPDDRSDDDEGSVCKPSAFYIAWRKRKQRAARKASSRAKKARASKAGDGIVSGTSREVPRDLAKLRKSELI